MATALAAVPLSTRDVLLDELATAPRPFPLQPSPSMAPSEHNSALSFASVGEQRVACFVIGGEPRLCFPQVISSCIPGCDVTEVSRLIEDLHIHLGNASQKQIDALKLSDALQQTVSTCVLIKKTDTERLIGELHVAKHGHKVPIDVDKSEMLLVKHDCFGGCKGNLYPSLFPRPCIECVECGNFFEPSHFMTHNHEKGAEILRTVHWGFDANNWRLMIRLRKAQRHCEHAKRAFERFLEPLVVNYLPASQKRHSSTMNGDLAAKRPALDLDFLLKKEQQRQHDLLQQLVQLPHVKEATAALLQLSQQNLQAGLTAITLSQNTCSSSASTPFHSQTLLSPTLLQPVKCEKIDVDLPVKAEPLFDVGSLAIEPTSSSKDDFKKRPDSEDSSDEDTLDALLAEHLDEPVLSAIRAKIADSQRQIRLRLDEVTQERDVLRNENQALRQQYVSLFQYVQHNQPQKQAAPQIPTNHHTFPQINFGGVKQPQLNQTPQIAPANLQNNALLLTLLQLQQQQQQQQQQNQLQAQITSQMNTLASMDPSILVNLGVNPSAFTSALVSNNKGVQLPTAQQIDPLRARLA